MDNLQLAICLPNCSGRGIRFKALGPSDHEKLSLDAAILVGGDATMLTLKRTEWAMGVKRMLTEVTVEGGYNQETLLGPDVKWKKVTLQDVDGSYDKWFNAKDHGVLTELFRQYHEVSMDDLKAISGKVLAVSGG
jgi:hypothetical protein